MTEHTPSFNNPYATVAKDDLVVVTCKVSKADYNQIKCMRPGLATITGVIGTLWQKLCVELRKRGINDWTRVDEFEEFVATCTITDGRGRFYDSPIGGHVPQTKAPDDRAREKGDTVGNKKHAPKLSNLQSRSGKGTA